MRSSRLAFTSQPSHASCAPGPTQPWHSTIHLVSVATTLRSHSWQLENGKTQGRRGIYQQATFKWCYGTVERVGQAVASYRLRVMDWRANISHGPRCRHPDVTVHVAGGKGCIMPNRRKLSLLVRSQSILAWQDRKQGRNGPLRLMAPDSGLYLIMN